MPPGAGLALLGQRSATTKNEAIQAVPVEDPMSAFGANEWLVDEMYEQYQKDPESVDPAWWDFFKNYRNGDSVANGAAKAPAAVSAAPAQQSQAAAKPAASPAPSAPSPAPSPAPAAP